MRAIVQRVTRASVTVDGDVTGAIDQGFCVLLGSAAADTRDVARHLADRVALLRICADEEGRMNQSLVETGGGVLVVSQFTLFADASRGHRPSFVRAGAPDGARLMCDAFVEALRERGLRVATGRFGARMQVDLTNDGPVTVALTSGEEPWDADAG